MKVVRHPFRSERSDDWTLERIAQLSVQDIKQLRENAERLNESGVAALCGEALAKRRERVPAPRKSGATTKPRRLVPRSRAFEARGVWVKDARTSWGGVRKSDGAVVIALWADAIQCTSGSCSYLLWAPNVDGSRPWSDQPGGIERLEHCKRALELGRAEGLLVYGERLADRIPEDRAHAIEGVDPETVVVFAVEQRGAEYWARWGKKGSALTRN
jgi:hypothetical protein